MPEECLGERRTRAGRGLDFDVSIRGWCVEKRTLFVAFDNASAHSQEFRGAALLSFGGEPKRGIIYTLTVAVANHMSHILHQNESLLPEYSQISNQ